MHGVIGICEIFQSTFLIKKALNLIATKELRMKYLILVTMMMMIVACSGRKFERDFKVIDASSKEIPEWIEEPKEWAEDEDEDDFKKSHYYVYETEPKNSRTLACEVAKARATEKIASEIQTFIKHEFAQVVEADQDAKTDQVEEYIQSNLAKDVRAHIVGAKVQKTYWEKRRFLKELGAKKDYSRYTCSALVKISKKNLDKAFKRIHKKLQEASKSTKAKEKLAQFVEKAQKEYNE
jgi:GTPase SAR1 family protein